MPSPPTRRKRPTNEDRSLPIVPILIGVIVLGFVIGAGLSLSGRHDATVVAVASRSPAGGDRFVPVTPAPTEKPTPQPTAEPLSTARAKIAHTAEPATPKPATPAPATAAPATAAPATPRRLAAAQAATPNHVAATGEPAAPPAPLAPRATTAPTESAGTGEAAPVTPKVTATTQAAAEPVATLQPQPLPEESAFTRLSAAVVRQYLESVKRSDQNGAFAVLASPPASEADLAEYGVVDERTRIARVDAHGAANEDVFVSVQMDTPNGPYFGQFTVRKNDTGAAVIVAHSIVKS